MTEHVDGMNSAHGAPYVGEEKTIGVIDYNESEGEQAARMAKVHETYGEQIARVPADAHAEKAAMFFAQATTSDDDFAVTIEEPKGESVFSAGYPEQMVCRAHRVGARGETPHIVYLDDAGFLPKNESEKRIDEILEKIEAEGDDEVTNEQLADHFNQELIAQGRNPVFSAQMLAAQNAAALRKQQQSRKKKKRK